jgi:ferritin
MISKEMAARLNAQMNLEFSSYYSYLAASAYCMSISLKGFGHWFAEQAEEERAHAMKIYKYLDDVDAQITLLPIAQPMTGAESMLKLFETTLHHEQKVTAAINENLGFAISDKDWATHVFLQWFITEQIEEESTVRDIVESLRLIKDSGDGLLILDREMASRTKQVD